MGPLATCLLSALQVREPRCIAPSAGYLRCRLSRCTNARPLTPRGDEAPASGCEARLACWVEGYPGTRRETRAATLGPDGEAVWEQELWLELHSWPPLLIVQLTLVAPADGAQLARGTARLALSDATSEVRWLSLEGDGPPRSDGERLGCATLLCGLVVQSVRPLLKGPLEQRALQLVDRAHHGDGDGEGEGEAMPTRRRGGGCGGGAAADACDHFGFRLSVPSASHAAAEQLRLLAAARQARVWAELVGPCCELPPSEPASDPAREPASNPVMGQVARAAAGGMPPALRPWLWLHYSGAAAMAEAAGEGYYERLLSPTRSEAHSDGEAEATSGPAPAPAPVPAAAPAPAPTPTPAESGWWASAESWRRRWLLGIEPTAASASDATAAAAAAAAAAAKEEMEEKDAAVLRQIELDLPRTFPEHAFFASEAGQDSLRRVLVAHARHHPVLGYTQSLNL